MIRKIISIDEEKCNGCGACANACHEGAIGMVNGKAKLLRDDYCDGLGDCLPACPVDAIHFIYREAAAYDEAAVLKHKQAKDTPHVCPGSMNRSFTPVEAAPTTSARPVNRLSQWPVQIKLANISAPFFDGADLLIAADCSAYAYAAFHEDFIRGRVTLVGCPKLDSVDYSEKLSEIFRRNDIRSILVVRMEVPCCGGLTMAVKKALEQSGKDIPAEVVTISTTGQILEN